MISSMKNGYSMTLLDFRRMAAGKLRDRKILPKPKKRDIGPNSRFGPISPRSISSIQWMDFVIA